MTKAKNFVKWFQEWKNHPNLSFYDVIKKDNKDFNFENEVSMEKRAWNCNHTNK